MPFFCEKKQYTIYVYGIMGFFSQKNGISNLHQEKKMGCIKVRTHDLTISEFAFLTAFPRGHGGFHTLALKKRGFKPTV